MVEYSGFLGPIQGQVTLDGSGTGTLRFAPAGEQWSIENISVSVSTHVNEATANVYLGYIGPQYAQSGTYAGSSGDSNDLSQPIPLTDGQALWVQWTGGDAGAIATAVLTGKKTVVNRGFRTA